MVSIYVIKIHVKKFQNLLAHDLEVLNSKYPQISIERKSYGNEVDYVAKAKFSYDIYPNASNISYQATLELRINASHGYVSKDALHELINYLRLVKAYIEKDNETMTKIARKGFAYFNEFSDMLVKIANGKIESNDELLEPLRIDEYSISTIEVFNKLLEILKIIAEPYNTPAINVKYMTDTGGDYPHGEFEFIYNA